MSTLTRLDITVPDTRLDLASGLMARHVSFGWEEQSLPCGATRLRLHTDNTPLLEQLLHDVRALLPEATIERATIEAQDWTAAWREFFTPVDAGRFVVLPPWLADQAPVDRQPIIIEPKSAFGTGHHASTVLCLEAISRVLDDGLPEHSAVLDLGTGTGVLGIACALRNLRVIGTDIDPIATDNALENIALNNVADRMTARTGSTEAVKDMRFDLILANILAGPLCDMAADIKALLRPNGRLILSGILDIQADAVAACYADRGEPLRLTRGEWVGLLW